MLGTLFPCGGPYCHIDITIQVLYIDDKPRNTNLAAAFPNQDDKRFEVETAQSVNEGLDALQNDQFDCIVSEYDMPRQSGLAFLQAVRTKYPDLPFILYTDGGSEEVASEAISAGVTDYIQKETDTSQFDRLSTRIDNAVDQYQPQREATTPEPRLQTLAENTKEIFWKFTADWNELLYINSQYEKIWGESIDVLRERPQALLDGVHPDDRPTVKEAMDQLSTGKSVDFECRVNADEDFGRWVWIQGEPVMDENGTVEKVAGFVRDITLRKEYEQELERQKAFTDNLLDTIEDVVYVLDSEGDFIDWNAAFEEVTEYTSEELESMNALDFFKEEDTEAAAAAIEESFETGHTRIELDLLTAAGESIPYEFIAKTFEEPGRRTLIAGIGRDRSQHVKYEHQLEEQRDNLKILNQVVRHDLRNNMNVVRGRTDLLEEHVKKGGEDDLEAVKKSTKKAIELTETARDLSETMLSTEEDVKPVRLDQHLKATIENARTDFDSPEVTIEDGIPDVSVRGNELLRAVFRNLIQNAIIHNGKEAPVVKISTALDEETVTVAIADNGPGIPDDQKEMIFGKGEVGLDSPGTGIGLYLVQTFVEQYGGDVWVEDNDPDGSVFYVELPLTEEAATE